MFYARRPTTRAQNPAEVLAAIPPGGRGWLIGTEENFPSLAAESSLTLVEVERKPYFKFQFSWNILDRGKSARDLLLVRADRAPERPRRNRARGPRVPRRGRSRR
jgi:hypothetical protein